MTLESAVEPARDTPYRAAVLVLIFALIPWFGYGGPLGYVLPAGAGGLLLAPLALRFRWPPLEWLALAALAVWASAAALWSPALGGDPFGSYDALERFTPIKLWLQLALYGLFAVAAVGVSSGGARRAMWALVAFMVPWAVLLLADGISGGRAWVFITGLFGVETPVHLWAKKAAEGGYVFAVLAWPALGFLVGRGQPAAALALLTAATIGMAALGAWSAVVAVFAGLAAVLLVGAVRGRGSRAIGFAMAIVTVLTPLLVLAAARSGLSTALRDQVTASWAARIDIWSFAAARIAEKPFGGWGLDSSRTFGTAVPLHPHDASLQLWLELGIVGALIVSAFWLLLARRLARLTEARPVAGQVATATATAYFTVGALSFGVWQDWWLAVGALAVAVCAANAKVRPGRAAELSDIAFNSGERRGERHVLPDDDPAV